MVRDCGGKGLDYIYKIVINGLQEYDLDEKIMRAMPSGRKISWKSDGLKAYMDAPTLQGARTIVIDLKIDTAEWAFFTDIPSDRIVAYKKDTPYFLPMKDVVAQRKTLW